MTLEERIKQYSEEGQKDLLEGEDKLQLASLLKELEKLREKEYAEQVSRAYELQYLNLRSHVYNDLVTPYLGSDYYNYGCDSCSIDTMSCRDLAMKLKAYKDKSRLYKCLCFLLAFICLYILFS